MDVAKSCPHKAENCSKSPVLGFVSHPHFVNAFIEGVNRIESLLVGEMNIRSRPTSRLAIFGLVKTLIYDGLTHVFRNFSKQNLLNESRFLAFGFQSIFQSSGFERLDDSC